MSAVGGLCMTETIGAKRSSVRHRAQREGLKRAALTRVYLRRTQRLKNARRSETAALPAHGTVTGPPSRLG